MDFFQLEQCDQVLAFTQLQLQLQHQDQVKVR